MYKKKKITSLFLSLIFIFSFSIICSAVNTTDINSLIENAKQLDKREITIQGELIGEELERGEYSWINVNDTTNAIGVWISSKELKDVTYYGNYKNKGDIVRITGTFNRACTEHGGDTDIHCSNFEIVQKGSKTIKKISNRKLTVAGLLVVIALSIFLIYLRLNRKSKK